MARGVNPAVTVSYVLEEDRKLPESDRSVFHIKPIPAKVQSDLQDGLFSFGGNIGKVAGGEEAFNEVRYHAGKVQLETFIHGVERIERYKIPMPLDEERVSYKDLAWDGKGMSRAKKLELLDFIAPKHRAEVARAIDDLSTLSEEETKNSEEQS